MTTFIFCAFGLTALTSSKRMIMTTTAPQIQPKAFRTSVAPAFTTERLNEAWIAMAAPSANNQKKNFAAWPR